MTQSTIQSRICILMNLLGEEAFRPILDQLPPDQAASLKPILDELETSPPSDDEIEAAIDEFQRNLSLLSTDHEQIDEEPPEEQAPEVTVATATGDPRQDVALLSTAQLSSVVETENDRAAAIVLACVEPDVAASVLECLPPEKAEAIFLHLQSPPQIAESVEKLILKRVFDRGKTLSKEKPQDPAEASIERLAQMLKNMDRETRSTMLNRLREADAETAEEVSDKLYVFEDLSALADRSVQAILGEVASGSLAVALKDATDDLKEKILSNMSKRARAGLLEEIEFLGSVQNEERENAVNEICKAMAALDELGQLEMETAT